MFLRLGTSHIKTRGTGGRMIPSGHLSFAKMVQHSLYVRTETRLQAVKMSSTAAERQATFKVSHVPPNSLRIHRERNKAFSTSFVQRSSGFQLNVLQYEASSGDQPLSMKLQSIVTGSMCLHHQ